MAGSGNIATNLKNISYSSGTGILTPANTRPFLLLASLLGESNTTSQETAIEIYADGNLIDGAAVLIHSGNDTNEESYGLLKTLTGGETVSGRYNGGSGNKITTKKGTSFSVLDLSNNDGAGTPSAFISFAVAADSDSQAGGDSNAFDEDNWTSYSTTVHSAATNITYTSSDGTFVVSNSGKYLILWNLFVGTATHSITRDVKILKNGSTVYTTPLMVHTSFDPDEKTVCVILDASAGDSFTFVVNKLRGKIDNGTSITMVKIDDLKDLYVQSTPTDSLIANDFTINSFSAQGLSPQHDRTGTEQVPFVLGVKGPMSLRGRRLDPSAAAPNISMGRKKN